MGVVEQVTIHGCRLHVTIPVVLGVRIRLPGVRIYRVAVVLALLNHLSDLRFVGGEPSRSILQHPVQKPHGGNVRIHRTLGRVPPPSTLLVETDRVLVLALPVVRVVQTLRYRRVRQVPPVSLGEDRAVADPLGAGPGERSPRSGSAVSEVLYRLIDLRAVLITLVDAYAFGTFSTCPTAMSLMSVTCGFAALSASTETPSLLAMPVNVSPETTV